MHNGVKSQYAGQRAVGHWQRQHVPLLEHDVRVPLASLAHEFGRQVQAAHRDSQVMKKGGRLSGAAAQVIHFPLVTHLGCKAREEFAIQGFMGEFADETLRIFPRDRVVKSLDRIRRWPHGTFQSANGSGRWQQPPFRHAVAAGQEHAARDDAEDCHETPIA